MRMRRLALAAILSVSAGSSDIHDVLKSSAIDAMLARAGSGLTAHQRSNFSITLATGAEESVTHPDFDELVFVRRGRARLSLKGNDRETGAGDVINIPRGTAHRIAPEEARFDRIVVRIFRTSTQPPPAGGAPARATLDGVLTNAEIEDTLAHASANRPIHFANNYTMNYVIYSGKSGPWEAHRGCVDIYFVRTGTATAQLGGNIENAKEDSPGEIRGSGVTGARSSRIGPGDVVLIPRDTPHHMQPSGEKLGYILVKVWAE